MSDSSFSPASSAPGRRKRVALLLPRFSRYGGAEQFGYRLAEDLARRGYRVDFICARQEIPAPEGVRVISVGRPPGLKAVKMLWFLYRAEQLCAEGDYDLVVGLGKTWSQDIIRMGGGPLKVFWEKSELALPAGLQRLAKKISRRLKPSNWLTLFLEKHQFTRSTEVVAVSHLVRDWLLSAHPVLNPDKVQVVFNRPDPQRYSYPYPGERRAARERLALSQGMSLAGDGADAIAFVGTASTNFQLKGVEPLIRAFARLPQQTYLFIAGGRARGAYTKIAQQLGVGDRVFFCGKVDDMPSFYKALDMFVLPTFYDACSNAVLEALASGCRVISSGNDGASFFLDPAHILPDPGDVEDLSARMETLLRQPTPEPFVWPADVPSGLDTFIELLEERFFK